MLSYKDELEYVFNVWLSNHKFSCSAKLSTDFAYDEQEEILYFGLFIPNVSHKAWGKLLEKWGLETDYGTFVTCFLHELGHHETLHLATEFERVYSGVMKVLIKAIPNKYLQNYIYFSLPVEKLATQWAIDYMNSNPDTAKLLQLVAQHHIDRFLEKNDYIE